MNMTPDWEYSLPGHVEKVLARRLKHFREQVGLTQQQLAEQMTVRGYPMHRSAIAKIETEARPVTVGEAMTLAAILGVQLHNLTTEPSLRMSGVGTLAVERGLRFEQARLEARIQVRALELEMEARLGDLQNLQAIVENTAARLEAARKREADLK